MAFDIVGRSMPVGIGPDKLNVGLAYGVIALAQRLAPT
jgi:hypothetical protein